MAWQVDWLVQRSQTVGDQFYLIFVARPVERFAKQGRGLLDSTRLSSVLGLLHAQRHRFATQFDTWILQHIGDQPLR